MKRIAPRILLSLLLGALINFAVAWCCVLWSKAAAKPVGPVYQLGGPPNYLPQAPPDILEHVPPAWLQNPYYPSRPGAVCVDRLTGLGVHLVRTTITYDHPPDDPPGEVVLQFPSYELDTVEAGWPARALETWIEHDLVIEELLPPGSIHRRVQRGPGHPGRYDWSWGTPATRVLSSFSGSPFIHTRSVLPLKPRPLAFAVNTAFYATLAWLLCGGPASIRRAWRTRNHQCAACAYPTGTSPICTECGKPVTPRAAAPA
jgi:hypothetical protein